MRWIEEVFKDCLCNLNDQISFALGIASLVCWSVAEIPQIITNFTSKSATGVSLAFLSTWIIGSVLDFVTVPSILGVVKLPTQFYTALVKYGTFVAATANLPRLSEALRRALVAQPLLQGLNPLMFVFALVANATYTGSILVRNAEWRMIKANMPWLLDAIVCVGLDLFIILQYIFYKYVKLKKREEYYGNYVEADKPA
ncbi:UNVERIFIED_CONTAM: hypothetical protein Sindi_2442300 [Sesamum indicum]